MADARDHGYRRSDDGAGQLLIIEGPEIFHRATAAHQQQHVDLSTLHRLAKGLQQLTRRLCTLHAGRVNHHRDMRCATRKRADHIVQSSGTQRGDDANGAWQQRQAAFTGNIEQAFCVELGLQPRELLKPVALPGFTQ